MTHRGVILVMYDLPVASAVERKSAAKFRKDIMKLGYVPMQKSVYVKLLRQYSLFLAEIRRLDKIKPYTGLVQVLPLGLADFKKMGTIVGEGFDVSIFADDILVI